MPNTENYITLFMQLCRVLPRFAVDDHRMNKMQLTDHSYSLQTSSLNASYDQMSKKFYQPISQSLDHRYLAVYYGWPLRRWLNHTRLVAQAVHQQSCGTSLHHKPTNHAPCTTRQSLVIGHLHATHQQWASPSLHHHQHQHNRFIALFPGPSRWTGARRELLDFMVQGKINRGRHTDHPAGRHSIWTKQCSPPPSAHFLQAGCPSCRPTNSVKALKATSTFRLRRRR